MILWPIGMPQYLNVDGYQEQDGNQMLRSSMDAGPQKVRRRFTLAPRPLSAQLLITPAQLTLFKYWYNNVLLGGTLRFSWVDPWSGITLTNLITNGGFDTSTTGWTPFDSTLASIPTGVFSNCLEVTMVSGNTQGAEQLFSSLSVGNDYILEGYAKSGTSGDAGFGLYLQDSGIANRYWLDSVTTEEWVYASIEFTVVDPINKLVVIKASSTAGTMLFDEISLRDITTGIVEMRFVEPPSWDTQDGLNITLNMNLEILP